MSAELHPGRPPRAQAELRRLLESIHRAAPQWPAGPGVAYLSPPEPEPLPPRSTLPASHPRNRSWYRRTLLDGGATVGGIAGALIAANVAACLFALPHASWALLPIGLIASSMAAMIGTLSAWRVIVSRRRDLFATGGTAA